MTHRLPAEFRGQIAAHRLVGLAILIGVLLLPATLGAVAIERLRYDRAALAAGELWRGLSAHLVHYDLRHLGMNVAGLALLWWLFVADLPARAWVAVASVSAVAVSGGLYVLDPAVSWYLGLSGVLHGVWAAAAVAAWRRWRLESGVTLALLACKLLLERWQGPLSSGVDPGFAVIVVAHLYGAVGGLVAALALRLARRPL